MPPARDTPALRQASDLLSRGQLAQARAVLLRVLRGRPDAAASALMARILLASGERVQAMHHAGAALAAEPIDPVAMLELGNTLHTAGESETAAEAYGRALAGDPTQPGSLVGLSSALNALGRHDEALAVCDRGLAAHPAYPRLIVNKGTTLLKLGRAREAAAVQREAARSNPGDLQLAIGVAAALNYAGGVDPREVFEAHKRVARLIALQSPPALPQAMPDRDPERRLRVGLVSGDLREHSVTYFLEPLLERHDRNQLRFVCYHTGPREDAFSARLRSHAELWRPVATLEPDALARKVRADAIDILIDLSGQTMGHRLGTFRMRPAPIQATWLGYPATTGVEAIDYRIVDSLTDPPGEADSLCVESLARLDPCFLCYRPLEDAPSPEPRRAGPITFASFNTLPKLDDDSVQLWARTLAAVPGSRLLLKTHSLADPAVRAGVAARFAAAGLAPQRLELAGPTGSLRDHLASYARADIALDTTPYCGTTTTCEALLMGVPVVSLVGRTHATRVGLSVLTAAGVPELAAPTPEQFIETARALATDAARLTDFRATLRPRLLRSTLCDADAFARRFEALLRGWWRSCNAHHTG